MPGYTDFKGLKVDISDGVVVLTLNRPERLNAIDRTTHAELEDVFLRLNDDQDVRAVLITGAGRAFCTGGDIKGMADASIRVPRPSPSYEAAHAFLEKRKRVFKGR